MGSCCTSTVKTNKTNDATVVPNEETDNTSGMVDLYGNLCTDGPTAHPESDDVLKVIVDAQKRKRRKTDEDSKDYSTTSASSEGNAVGATPEEPSATQQLTADARTYTGEEFVCVVPNQQRKSSATCGASMIDLNFNVINRQTVEQSGNISLSERPQQQQGLSSSKDVQPAEDEGVATSETADKKEKEKKKKKEKDKKYRKSLGDSVDATTSLKRSKSKKKQGDVTVSEEGKSDILVGELVNTIKSDEGESTGKDSGSPFQQTTSLQNTKGDAMRIVAHDPHQPRSGQEVAMITAPDSTSPRVVLGTLPPLSPTSSTTRPMKPSVETITFESERPPPISATSTISSSGVTTFRGSHEIRPGSSSVPNVLVQPLPSYLLEKDNENCTPTPQGVSSSVPTRTVESNDSIAQQVLVEEPRSSSPRSAGSAEAEVHEVKAPFAVLDVETASAASQGARPRSESVASHSSARHTTSFHGMTSGARAAPTAMRPIRVNPYYDAADQLMEAASSGDILGITNLVHHYCRDKRSGHILLSKPQLLGLRRAQAADMVVPVFAAEETPTLTAAALSAIGAPLTEHGTGTSAVSSGDVRCLGSTLPPGSQAPRRRSQSQCHSQTTIAPPASPKKSIVCEKLLEVSSSDADSIETGATESDSDREEVHDASTRAGSRSQSEVQRRRGDTDSLKTTKSKFDEALKKMNTASATTARRHGSFTLPTPTSIASGSHSTAAPSNTTTNTTTPNTTANSNNPYLFLQLHQVADGPYHHAIRNGHADVLELLVKSQYSAMGGSNASSMSLSITPPNSTISNPMRTMSPTSPSPSPSPSPGALPPPPINYRSGVNEIIQGRAPLHEAIISNNINLVLLLLDDFVDGRALAQSANSREGTISIGTTRSVGYRADVVYPGCVMVKASQVLTRATTEATRTESWIRQCQQLRQLQAGSGRSSPAFGTATNAPLFSEDTTGVLPPPPLPTLLFVEAPMNYMKNNKTVGASSSPQPPNTEEASTLPPQQLIMICDECMRIHGQHVGLTVTAPPVAPPSNISRSALGHQTMQLMVDGDGVPVPANSDLCHGECSSSVSQGRTTQAAVTTVTDLIIRNKEMVLDDDAIPALLTASIDAHTDGKSTSAAALSAATEQLMHDPLIPALCPFCCVEEQPLHTAIRCGHYEIAAILLKKMLQLVLMNTPDGSYTMSATEAKRSGGAHNNLYDNTHHNKLSPIQLWDMHFHRQLRQAGAKATSGGAGGRSSFQGELYGTLLSTLDLKKDLFESVISNFQQHQNTSTPYPPSILLFSQLTNMRRFRDGFTPLHVAAQRSDKAPPLAPNASSRTPTDFITLLIHCFGDPTNKATPLHTTITSPAAISAVDQERKMSLQRTKLTGSSSDRPVSNAVTPFHSSSAKRRTSRASLQCPPFTPADIVRLTVSVFHSVMNEYIERQWQGGDGTSSSELPLQHLRLFQLWRGVSPVEVAQVGQNTKSSILLKMTVAAAGSGGAGGMTSVSGGDTGDATSIVAAKNKVKGLGGFANKRLGTGVYDGANGVIGTQGQIASSVWSKSNSSTAASAHRIYGGNTGPTPLEAALNYTGSATTEIRQCCYAHMPMTIAASSTSSKEGMLSGIVSYFKSSGKSSSPEAPRVLTPDVDVPVQSLGDLLERNKVRMMRGTQHTPTSGGVGSSSYNRSGSIVIGSAGTSAQRVFGGNTGTTRFTSAVTAASPNRSGSIVGGTGNTSQSSFGRVMEKIHQNDGQYVAPSYSLSPTQLPPLNARRPQD